MISIHNHGAQIDPLIVTTFYMYARDMTDVLCNIAGSVNFIGRSGKESMNAEYEK